MKPETVSMLREFGPNIWVVDGPILKAAAGFHFPTRMAVIRLDNGELAIWSPTALSDALRHEIEALGTISYLLPPNSLHHTFLGDWQKAYPDATVFAPPRLRQIRPDVRFDADFAAGPVAAWSDQLDFSIIRGNRITEEVVFFHRQSATAIFTDLLQHFPANWFSGWRAVIARLDLMVAPEPAVPRKFRLAFTDRTAARQAMGPVLDWPTQKVVFAHGAPVMSDGAAYLRRAFAWLAP